MDEGESALRSPSLSPIKPQQERTTPDNDYINHNNNNDNDNNRSSNNSTSDLDNSLSPSASPPASPIKLDVPAKAAGLSPLR